MCSGGGGGATITEPNYQMYNSQYAQQKSLIDSQTQGPIQEMQAKLNSSILNEQSALQANLELQKSISTNTTGQANRLAALMGPPPPEKSATAPTVGKNKKALGKSGLRIDANASKSSAAGTGLNIT